MIRRQDSNNSIDTARPSKKLNAGAKGPGRREAPSSRVVERRKQVLSSLPDVRNTEASLCILTFRQRLVLAENRSSLRKELGQHVLPLRHTD